MNETERALRQAYHYFDGIDPPRQVVALGAMVMRATLMGLTLMGLATTHAILLPGGRARWQMGQQHGGWSRVGY